MDIVLISLLVLGGTGVLAAAVLYAVAKKFYVAEDPRVEKVEACLPGANCGACGYSGCHDFAVKCVAAESLDGFNCPGAGTEGMAKIADILGIAAEKSEPRIAVVRCNGSCENRPARVDYDGASSCALLATVAAGVSGCAYGCLGCGDCVAACPWGAMTMDATTGLPVIIEDKCVACGLCVKACPRQLIELRRRGPRGMRVWVACRNKDRGGEARKSCAVACIGCSKCLKVCTHDAITVENFLSYIDSDKCRLCRKCVAECPTGAILDVNFPKKVNQKENDNV